MEQGLKTRIPALELKECLAWLPQRAADSHKGDFGKVGLIGGAPGMAGAALLAGRAALNLGAGRVYVGLMDERIALDPLTPELMVTRSERIIPSCAPDCVVVGPGMGTEAPARERLGEAIDALFPLLIDADGLNLLSLDADLQSRVGERPAPTLLTPHPGEAGRLLSVGTGEVQADRPGAVQALAERYHCVVVLKGAGSLICSPDGGIWRNDTGNPGMAAPGMGDVLSGMIAALLVQGLTPIQAICLGVVIHGAAGDAAVAAGHGPVGLTAGELIRQGRRLLNGV